MARQPFQPAALNSGVLVAAVQLPGRRFVLLARRSSGPALERSA